ncbi:MAG: AsnC family transcriptional regulator [Gammaproteobacteria bacterium]|nr:AsnC family transcriptional regulator [Gammaproteobacteria bacterium]
MDELSRRIINQYQGGIPVVEHPFASMAEALGCQENTLISTLKALLGKGILSRFGPMYNSSCMGGGLTLAAMSIPEERFDQVAERVNSLPEVAHNYRREHELNMWFVIATETPEGIHQTIDKIERQSGIAVYNFPKTREFYLGLWLVLDQQGQVTTRSTDIPVHHEEALIDELDRKIIRATQQGLPLDPSPYSKIATQCGCDTETVMHRFQRMLNSGAVRRIGAVPNHYRLGLRSNGMSVWDISDDQLELLGNRIGGLDFVSHCYQRPRHMPLWPYNLFAMVHGHNPHEVNYKIQQISDLVGADCQQQNVLFSSRILKKSGLRLVA